MSTRSGGRLSAANTINLKHIILHNKSRKLEYIFADKEPIIRDYSKSKGQAMRVQAWNIMYRYSDLTGKELEVFKFDD